MIWILILTRHNEVIQTGKSLFQLETDCPQSNTVRESHISMNEVVLLVDENESRILKINCSSDLIMFLLMSLLLTSSLLALNIPTHMMANESGQGSRLNWSHHLRKKRKVMKKNCITFSEPCDN